jgi:predicted N-formylglutamate amidohydrolase
MKLIVTCEHGGNKIPTAYKSLFKDCDALHSHRGYDLGALDVFKHLTPLANASAYSETSRLLIELNRSLHHKKLFSEYSKALSKSDKNALISDYYLKYRNDVELTIKSFIKDNNTVLHLSVHSFTPKLNGDERNCDIGLLFDSRNTEEKEICKQLKTKLLQLDTALNVRFNYPYLGKADGFTTYLRKQFPNNYLGIELEINQKYVKNNEMDVSIKSNLFTAIKSLIN